MGKVDTHGARRTSAHTTGVSKKTRTDGGQPLVLGVEQGYGFGRREHGPRGGKAAQADRDSREAWGVPVRSAYLRRVALPQEVAPGNTGAAAEIVYRIDGCLQEHGRWTEKERRRLKVMRDAWALRAAGRDIVFQVVGWQRMRTWYGPGDRGRRQDETEARRFQDTMRKVEEIWQGTSTRDR